jgi:hypothetical protein
MQDVAKRPVVRWRCKTPTALPELESCGDDVASPRKPLPLFTSAAGSALMGVDRAVTVGAASASRKADIYLQR